MFYILFILIVFCALTLYAENSNVLEIIKTANSHFSKNEDTKALDQYRKALKSDSKNFEALWKTSRSCSNIGDLEKDNNKKIALFKEAESLSKIAVELYPDSAMAHFYLGVALGRIALNVGNKEKLKLALIIKQEFIKTTELDPEFSYAWHALGRWYREIATLSWIERKFANMLFGKVPEASLEEAEMAFNKAIKLDPNGLANYTHLGITYEKKGNHKLAIKNYKKAISIIPIKLEDKKNWNLAKLKLKKIL